MREQDFMAALMVRLCKVPGVRVWRQPAGQITTNRLTAVTCAPVGAADVTGIVGPEGWTVQVECKMRGRKRTPEQVAWARMVAEHGAIYLLAVCDPRPGIDAEVERVANELEARIEERRVLGRGAA